MNWNNTEWKNQIAKLVAETFKPMAKKINSNKNRPYYKTNSKKSINNSILAEAKDFIFGNAPVAIAGVSLLVVTVLGVYCFVNIDKSLLGIEVAAAPVFSEKEVVKEIVVLTEAPKGHEDGTQLSDQVKQADQVKMFTRDDIKNIKEDLKLSVDVYKIIVNGKEIAYVEKYEDAQSILDKISATYLEEGSTVEESYFGENVEILKAKKDIAIFNGYELSENIIKYILRGTDEERIHKVEKGENYWLIAEDYNISVDNLLQANPKINPDRLQIGQEISLIVPKPLISVVTKEIMEYSESIAFETTYEDSSSYYKGEFSVKKSGNNGERKVIAEVFKENGIEKERLIVQETILSEPTTKIVYKGTKNPPPRIGTGVLARPTSRGTISSGYGMRWGRRHNGIDIAIPTGTPVKAADGGVVIFSGTNGAYGKCVIIDHGANVSTLYAHNSQLLVKKGDKVFKGETVAKSGNTGRSTGPHLHFEVRKNNVPTNPTAYVKY